MTNNQATLHKLDQMRLHGMARALRTSLDSQGQWTADELLAHLVDAECDDRHERRLKRLLKAARFRYPGRHRGGRLRAACASVNNSAPSATRTAAKPCRSALPVLGTTVALIRPRRLVPCSGYRCLADRATARVAPVLGVFVLLQPAEERFIQQEVVQPGLA